MGQVAPSLRITWETLKMLMPGSPLPLPRDSAFPGLRFGLRPRIWDCAPSENLFAQVLGSEPLPGMGGSVRGWKLHLTPHRSDPHPWGEVRELWGYSRITPGLCGVLNDAEPGVPPTETPTRQV